VDNGAPRGSWVLNTTIQLHGHPLAHGTIRLPQSCDKSAGSRDGIAHCLAKLGYTQITKYQPAGRYWSFQFTEAAIFLALSAILTAVAVVALKHQDG